MAKKFNDPSVPELDALPDDHLIPVINPTTGKVNVVTKDKFPSSGGTSETPPTFSNDGFDI